jgi:hypothetical protein
MDIKNALLRKQTNVLYCGIPEGLQVNFWAQIF